MVLTKKQWMILALATFFSLVPLIAYGAGLSDRIVPCDGIDCSICHLGQLAQNILNAAIFIAVFLSAILFSWAGFKMLVSPASSSQVSSAKSIFLNVLIGFIIILGAWLVINAIMSIMVDGKPGLPWNKICSSVQTNAAGGRVGFI